MIDVHERVNYGMQTARRHHRCRLPDLAGWPLPRRVFRQTRFTQSFTGGHRPSVRFTAYSISNLVLMGSLC